MVNGTPTSSSVTSISTVSRLRLRSLRHWPTCIGAGDLAALQRSVAVAPGMTDRAGAVGLAFRVGIDPKLTAADSFVPPSAEDLELPANKLIQSPDGSVVWDARDEKTAHVVINTPRTVGVWGLVGRQSVDCDSWHFGFGQIERDYAVAIATSRDGQTLLKSRSILLTVVSNGENQDMGWNADRTSVGTKWGHGPTVVNGVPLALTIPASQTARRLYALDSRGRRVQEISARPAPNDRITFNLGPQWKTLFYEFSDQ